MTISKAKGDFFMKGIYRLTHLKWRDRYNIEQSKINQIAKLKRKK